ncbi:hypothetical protein FYJ43_04375 [Cutibacterium sp. WCA-380-WT-3A]|uniref:Uncharacterized protein n=1 Tax=Cutibacterium porci TaxID=2605781 RepID=A0A7K0J5V6_9ACTN|nr:hypothetical protein [Cutibacterium porci]MSS45293.1 hypothetical protein [Cutibacterium porci]
MTDWVRISEPLCVRTVPADTIPKGAKIIDAEAVDRQGRPLPTVPRKPLGGTQPAKPANTEEK